MGRYDYWGNNYLFRMEARLLEKKTRLGSEPMPCVCSWGGVVLVLKTESKGAIIVRD